MATNKPATSEFNFPTTNYVNKTLGCTAALPSEDFEGGVCQLKVRRLLKQFREEPNDAVAEGIRKAAMLEAEHYEGLTNVTKGDEQMRNTLRYMYAVDCVSKMKL